MSNRLRRAIVGVITATIAVTGLTLGTAATASAGNTGEHLYKGETLYGYQNAYIGRWTSGAVWKLVMQSDGNLVEYKEDALGYNRHACWDTGTWWAGDAYATYQDDGNLVVYRTSDRAVLWASGTNGKGGSTVDINSSGQVYVGTTRITNGC